MTGVPTVAFLIVPRLVSKDDLQRTIGSTIQKALTTDSTPKDTIAGAPVQTINPFLNKQDRELSYRWQKGDNFAYEFTYEAVKKPGTTHSTFKVDGECQYIVGEERPSKEEVNATGTCFSIAKGYLVTCAHVIQSANRIQVKFGEQKFAARIVDVDYKNDLAILAYHGTIEPLVLADSSGLELAENILVMGFPISEVMGENIKVSAGIISGIDKKPGRNAIAIDGAINPGNSGGPVLNQAGQVVGIASATLTGKGINPVGFACRVDELRSLMSKNQIAPIATKEVHAVSKEATIESKEIVRRATPGVGFLEVSGTAADQLRSIQYTAVFSGSMQSPIVTINGVRQDGVKGKLSVGRFGDVVHSSEHQLPYQFVSIPALIMQPFELMDQERWFKNDLFVFERSSPSRFSFGMNAFVRSHLNDILPGGRSNEEAPKIHAISESKFEVIEHTDESVSVKRTRRFATQDGDNPSLEVKGEGVWVFDLQKGRPRSLVEDSIVTQRTNGVVTETPYVLKITPISTKTLEQRNQDAKTRREEQERMIDNERRVPSPELVGQLLDQVAKVESRSMRSALDKLATVAIVEEKRGEVLSSLRKIINGKDRFDHDAGWRAFSHWADTSCAPELRKIVNESKVHRKNALAALLDLGIAEDAVLLIEHIEDLPHGAAKKFAKFGPSVESLVLQQLTKVDNVFQQRDLLEILETIGTEDSIKHFEQKRSSMDRSLALRWEITIQRIRMRTK
ncbi:MAG: S1C family serine protease [Pirellula sp.]